MNSARRLRVLAVTSLFPNPVSPHSSAFNRQQLTHLSKLCDLEIWAPVPWFPFSPRLAPNSSAAKAAAVPAVSSQAGMKVRHPRTLQIPVVGRPIAGPLYAASLARSLQKCAREFDVVLGTWAYPDGWAMTVLGKLTSLPTVVKVHGSDINVVAAKPAQRAQMRAVLPRSRGIIAVSRPLAKRVEALGVPPERIHHVPNGIDQTKFSIRDRSEAQAALGIESGDGKETVIYIGNLKREKGVLDLLDAWPTVSEARENARLYIIGDGPCRDEVTQRCSTLDGVEAIGAVSHDQVATWMSATNLLCLPSWNEGMPNVVVEAHASGRAVVASRVGGVPDLITSSVLGRMVEAKSPQSIAAGLLEALANPSPAEKVRAAASIISWSESAERVLHVLERAVQ